MSRYLDPKADIVFKKIFAEHPHLLISFLNAVLPLTPEQHILTVEYLPSELVPRIPGFKSTIVDVRCTDKQGRLFIVEMQILWLRFMSELDQTTTTVASELLAIPEIKEAVSITEQAAYSPAELDAYDRFWDAVSTEKTLKAGAYAEGKAEGKAEIAINMLKDNESLDKISRFTGLSQEDILKLKEKL